MFQVNLGRNLAFEAGYLEFQETIWDYPPGRIGKAITLQNSNHEFSKDYVHMRVYDIQNAK